jgi:hypothetical protein
MTTDSTRTRPLRNVTATVTATGSALSVVLVPLVVGALVARTVGGDPMVSVNALIAGGGQRAKLSRSQLRGYRCRALAAARVAPGRSARWSSRRTGGETSIGS